MDPRSRRVGYLIDLRGFTGVLLCVSLEDLRSLGLLCLQRIRMHGAILGSRRGFSEVSLMTPFAAHKPGSSPSASSCRRPTPSSPTAQAWWTLRPVRPCLRVNRYMPFRLSGFWQGHGSSIERDSSPSKDADHRVQCVGGIKYAFELTPTKLRPIGRGGCAHAEPRKVRQAE